MLFLSHSNHFGCLFFSFFFKKKITQPQNTGLEFPSGIGVSSRKVKLPHHFHRFFFQQTWINIEFQLHRQFYEPISESVCWALLNQQWQGRWARVTMSSCLFWDQLRQYSQVWANRLHATYKNIFLEKKYTRLFCWACSRLRALNLALTLFFFWLTFT